MTTRGSDIVSVIKRQIEEFQGELRMVDVGTVVEAGDGIARIQGLQGAQYSELLEFPEGVLGLALNLEEDTVGAAIMGDPNAVKEGDTVRSTGRIIEVPVGDELVGRVVDALGRPLDGKGPIRTTKVRPIERIAPNVVTRQSVDTPVQTGIKAIDSMIPIGRGQRELIIGDRSTGKSAIALDAIINQKGQNLTLHLRSHRTEAGERWPRWCPHWRSTGRWSTQWLWRQTPPTRRRSSTLRPTPVAPLVRRSWRRGGRR